MFPTAKGIIINPKKFLSTSSSHQKICSLCPNCKSLNCKDPKTRQCNLFEGGPLLFMELAFLLRGVGSEVCWITNQKPSGTDQVIYSLENKMLDRGVQVFSAKSQEAIKTALKADMVILNTAVTGKWDVLKENVPHVLPKVLWWIHEMRDYYFSMDYVKHLPSVVGDMIDSHVTAEYWKNRTQEHLIMCLIFKLVGRF